jgi:hypothetical protein
MQLLVFGCCGAGWDDWVGWRFNFWDDGRLLVASQVDGWIVKKAEVPLAVSPCTGNSHEVSKKNSDEHLDFLRVGSPKTHVRMG